jgi:hypothetical protein
VSAYLHNRKCSDLAQVGRPAITPPSPPLEGKRGLSWLSQCDATSAALPLPLTAVHGNAIALSFLWMGQRGAGSPHSTGRQLETFRVGRLSSTGRA